MSKEAAFNILVQDLPQYHTSDSTKKVYSQLNALASAKSGIGKAIDTNIKRYSALGRFDPQKSAYYKSAYDALKQQYRTAGKAALQNGIAAAAANTGGFGNSYGATAGARAYEAQLQALAAKVPALYSAAASAFAGEKNDLATLIGMQQAQQQAALENAQFKVGVQQSLDAQRYRAALERDKALRELAKLQLQYG